jgi:hypothetical protein
MWDNISKIFSEDVEDVEKSAQKTINIKAEEFDNYNDFVAAKIKTISPAIIILMTESAEDSQILHAVQTLWLKEFWETRKFSPGMKN